MISWACFLAVVAAVSAAPQTIQTVSSPQVRTQTIRYSQLPVQTVQSLPVQSFGVQSLPVQSLGVQSLPVQTYQSVPIQYQQYQPYQVQSVQSLPVQQFSSVSQIPSVAVQSVSQYQPVSSVVSGVSSVQQAQPDQVQYSNVPVSNIRLEDIKPKTSSVVRTQTSSVSALPIIQATAAPAVRISSTPVSVTAVPQVHLPVQVHHVQPVAQVHHVQPVTQVHHVQPAVHRIAVQVPVAPRIQTARTEGGFAILRQVQDVQADGTYEYAYETENGIKAQEHGELKNAGTENESNSVTGSYSYTDPEGRQISVQYIADENGFRAEGDHIPKVPEPILRSLEYLRSLPQQPEDNK